VSLSALCLAFVLAVLLWSGIAPALVALPTLVLTYKRFPLTPLSYRLILLHAGILMLGGHYTYAEVPLGDWMKDAFGTSA